MIMINEKKNSHKIDFEGLKECLKWVLKRNY